MPNKNNSRGVVPLIVIILLVFVGVGIGIWILTPQDKLTSLFYPFSRSPTPSPTEIPEEGGENSWEKSLNGLFENRGIAQIERWKDNYILKIYCNGIRYTYIKDNNEFSLDGYLEKFIIARYTYIEEKENIVCIKAPCLPVTVTKLLIKNIEEVAVSNEELSKYKEACSL